MSSRCWDVTYNNPEGEPDFSASPRKVKYACWNLEIGESGTLHYQIGVYFKDACGQQSAIDSMRAVLGTNAFSLRKARNAEAVLHYCKKPCDDVNCGREGCEEVRSGKSTVLETNEYGVPPEKQGARTDLKDLATVLTTKRSIEEVLCDPELNHKVARVMTWSKALIEANLKNEATFDDDLKESDLWKYQLDLVEILRTEKPKRRRVFWVHSNESGTGKSTLGRYLQERLRACLMTVDASANNLLARYLQFYRGESIIVLDIPRSIEASDTPKLYQMVEKLSDGGMMGGGFGQSRPVNVCAHIVVCSNLIVPGHTLQGRCIDIEAKKEEEEVPLCGRVVDPATLDFVL